MSRVAAQRRWGTVEWAIDSNGKMPAREYFLTLSLPNQAKMNALFGRFAEEGKIVNREKFRKLGSKGGDKYAHLFEFKSFQIRFLGDYRGRRFVVAHGVQKKKDSHTEADFS